MKKKAENGPISRKALTKAVQDKNYSENLNQSELDEFDREALEGMQLLNPTSNPQKIFKRLDRAIDKFLFQRDVTSIQRLNMLSKARLPFIVIGIAAALLLLLILNATTLSWISPQQCLQASASNYFEHLPLAIPTEPLTTRSGSKSETSAKNLALSYYEQGAYDKANAFFPAFLLNDQTDNRFQIYYGISLVGAKEYSKAIPVLLASRNADFHPSWQAITDWYLALAYLQSNEIDKAQPLLEKLSTSRNDYQIKASALLDKI